MKRRPIILKTAAPAILLGALTASVAAWALTFSPRGVRVAATVVAGAPAQAGPGANTTQGTDGLGALVPPEGAKPHPEKLKVPAGFSVAIWADNIKGPRTMTLASDGTVKHVLVIMPLGHGLSEQAVKAARAIKFTPATINGTPVSQYVILEYNFSVF